MPSILIFISPPLRLTIPPLHATNLLLLRHLSKGPPPKSGGYNYSSHILSFFFCSFFTTNFFEIRFLFGFGINYLLRTREKKKKQRMKNNTATWKCEEIFHNKSFCLLGELSKGKQKNKNMMKTNKRKAYKIKMKQIGREHRISLL